MESQNNKNMETLKLERLVGYLPYGLEVIYIDYDDDEQDEIITKIESISNRRVTFCSGADFIFENSDVEIKLLLYPLSCLTEEIEVNGRKINIFKTVESWNTTIDFVSQTDALMKDIRWLSTTSYCIVELLYEFHFDIHGLIEKGLAIDKRTVK